MDLHTDFFDTNIFLTAFYPSEEEKDKGWHISSMKTLTRSQNNEVIDVTSWLAILEFAGSLAEKSGLLFDTIIKMLERLEKFRIKVIYPTYMIPKEDEYRESSKILREVLNQWSKNAIRISAEYRLSGVDASHLLTAVENKCTRFITWDSYFLYNPLIYGKRLKELQYIQITSPDKIV
jgi:predicted nucleic acid-binding protein